MADYDRLISLIKLGREERFLEYKESLPWDGLKQKIAKTSMGMANIRDGGTIIIGVTQRNNRFIPEGMSNDHITTYDADEIQAYVNRFADPYVRIELHHTELEKMSFLAIVVHEFDEIPVICKRDSSNILREGAIYTRSYRIPETCEVRSQTEMREIIEMATEKGVRRFIKTLHRVGIPFEKIVEKLDVEAFNEQLKGL